MTSSVKVSIATTDRPIVEAVLNVASQRGVSPSASGSRLQILLNPVVSSPIVGATKPEHLNDAVALLDVELTPRRDHHVARGLSASTASRAFNS